MESKKNELHIAIVCRGPNRVISGGENGGWSSFLSQDREDAVNRALAHARKANEKHLDAQRYVVLVGTVTHEAKVPITYQLVEIG